jgi:hypothetical protein
MTPKTTGKSLWALSRRMDMGHCRPLPRRKP